MSSGMPDELPDEVTDLVQSGDLVQTGDLIQTGEVEHDHAPARRQRPAALMAVLLGVSAIVAASVYWWLYRPDQLTGESAQHQVLDAAKSGTEALLSYGPDTLDKDLAAAKSHLTGNFLDHYTKFTDDVVVPAAKQRGVKTEASVARSAVSQMRPDQAQVLVFVNQVTTSKDRPTPALATSSVLVTLVRSGGQWLISEFDPV